MVIGLRWQSWWIQIETLWCWNPLSQPLKTRTWVLGSCPQLQQLLPQSGTVFNFLWALSGVLSIEFTPAKQVSPWCGQNCGAQGLLFFFFNFYFVLEYSLLMGFPDGASGKESTCQGRRWKRHGFDPWVRKIPWRKKWQTIPVFLPGESHGQWSVVGYSPWRCKESNMTEAT